MPEFQPNREAVTTIVDTYYHRGVLEQPRQAAEFFLKLITNIELLRSDPLMDSATLPSNDGGTFNFTFSNNSLAIPMHPSIDVVHGLSLNGQERPIKDQPGFTEYDTVNVHLSSVGTMTPEPDLELKFWQAGKRTIVLQDGELVMPLEDEAKVDALGNPDLTGDDRAEMLIQEMKRSQKRNTAAYQMSCFIDLATTLRFLSFK